MRESAIDVLVYLFENYMNENAVLELLEEDDAFDLSVELTAAGFDENIVAVALNWLEHLPDPAPEDQFVGSEGLRSMRVYTMAELQLLGAECVNFLMEMERLALLSPMQREEVLDRVMALNADSIDIDQFKWLVCLVMFNTPQSDSPEQRVKLEQLEEWVYAAEDQTAQ